MPRGGAREGAGRKPGIANEVTTEAKKRALETGETPLDYMLRLMRDTEQPDDRRDKMAIAAASYVHPKAIEVTGGDGGPVQVEGITRKIIDA